MFLGSPELGEASTPGGRAVSFIFYLFCGHAVYTLQSMVKQGTEPRVVISASGPDKCERQVCMVIQPRHVFVLSNSLTVNVLKAILYGHDRHAA